MTINYDKIPQELKKYKRFVLFDRNKAPKTIYNTNAKANDQNTWNTFDECYKAWLNNLDKFLGIGFELGELEEGKVLAGIDIDHIIDDNGNIIDPSFEILIEKIDSYTEISPSGKGIHILFYLNKIMDSIKNNIEHFEFYSQGRYFTLTGNIYKDHKELKQLTTEDLDFILQNTIFIPDLNEELKESENLNQILIEKGITIEKIVNYYSEKYPEFKNLRKKGNNKYWTKSPFHSSNTGHNFELNYDKNVWYCWRHNIGGSCFELIAFCEGILSCKDYGLDPEIVRPRMSKDDKIKIWKNKKEQFRKTLEVLKEKFNIDLTMKTTESKKIMKAKEFLERSQEEQNEALENDNVLEFSINENKSGLIKYDDEYTTIKLITYKKKTKNKEKQKDENEKQEDELEKQEIEIVRFQGKIIRPVWIDEKEIGFEIERNNKKEALLINDVITYLEKDYFLSNQKLYHLRQILESFITYTKNTKNVEYYYSTPIQVVNNKIEVHYNDMEKINIEKNLRLIREYYNNATYPESFISEFAFTLNAPLFYELKKRSEKGVQTPYFLKLGETKSGKTPQSYIFIGKGYDLNLEDYYFPYERIKTEFTMMKTLAKTNFPLVFDDITTDWIIKNKENLKSYIQTNTFGSRGRGDQSINNYEGKSGLIFTMNTYLRPDEELAITLRFIIFYYTIEHKKRVNRELYLQLFNSLDNGFMFPIFKEIFGNKNINEVLNITEKFTTAFDWITFMINEINNVCKKYNIEPFPIPDYKYLTDMDNAYELFQAFVSEYERIEEAETQWFEDQEIKKMKYRSEFENEIKVEKKQNRIYVKFTAGAFKKMAKKLNLPYKNVNDFISNIYENSQVKVAYNGKPRSIKIKYPQNPVKAYTLYIEKEQLNESDILEYIKADFDLNNLINKNDLIDYLVQEFDYDNGKIEKFINNLITNETFKEREIEINGKKEKVLEFQGGISK